MKAQRERERAGEGVRGRDRVGERGRAGDEGRAGERVGVAKAKRGRER